MYGLTAEGEMHLFRFNSFAKAVYGNHRCKQPHQDQHPDGNSVATHRRTH